MTVPRAHVSHNVPARSVCISEKRAREKGLGDELLMLESEPRWKTYESGGLPRTPQIRLPKACGNQDVHGICALLHAGVRQAGRPDSPALLCLQPKSEEEAAACCKHCGSWLGKGT